jgi:hypothetical protein
MIGIGNLDAIKNPPHFPSLPGFPHHTHDPQTGSIVPSRPVSVLLILDVIALLVA